MAAESVTKSHLQTPADDGLLRAVFRHLLTLHFLVYKLGYIGVHRFHHDWCMTHKAFD